VDPFPLAGRPKIATGKKDTLRKRREKGKGKGDEWTGFDRYPVIPTTSRSFPSDSRAAEGEGGREEGCCTHRGMLILHQFNGLLNQGGGKKSAAGHAILFIMLSHYPDSKGPLNLE